MSSKDKQISVIIAGATSSIGRELVSRLVSHPNVQRVVALSRQPISVNRWATVFPHLHTGDALRYLSVVPVDWSKILTDTSRIPFSYVVNGSWHFTEMDARERRKLSTHLATLHELWTLPYKKTLPFAPLNNTTNTIDHHDYNNSNEHSTTISSSSAQDVNSNAFRTSASTEHKQRSPQNYEKGYVSSTFPRYSRVDYGRANSYRHRFLHYNREHDTPSISNLYSPMTEEVIQQHKIRNRESLEPVQEVSTANSNSSWDNNVNVNASGCHEWASDTDNLCAVSTQRSVGTSKGQHADNIHFTQAAAPSREHKHTWWQPITSLLTSFFSSSEEQPSLLASERTSLSPNASAGVSTSRKASNVLSDEEIMENKIFLQKLLENNFYNSVFAGHHVAINCLGSAHPLSSSELSQVDYGLSLAFTKVVRLFNCMSYVEASDEEERELVERISRQLNSELWGEIYTACYGTSSPETTPMLFSSSASSDADHNNNFNKDDISSSTQATPNSLSYNKLQREEEASGLHRRCTLQHFTQMSARAASEFSPIPYLRAHGRRDRDLVKMFGHTPSHNSNLESANESTHRARETQYEPAEVKGASNTFEKHQEEEKEQQEHFDNTTSNRNKSNSTEVSEEVAAEQARSLLLRRDVVHVNHHVNLTIWRPGVFRREYMRWPEWVISFLEQPLDLHCLAECVVDDIVESIHRYDESTKQQSTIVGKTDRFVESSSSADKSTHRKGDNEQNVKKDSFEAVDDIGSVTSTGDIDKSAMSSTLKIIGGKSVAQRVFMKAAEDGLDEHDTQSIKFGGRNRYTHW